MGSILNELVNYVISTLTGINFLWNPDYYKGLFNVYASNSGLLYGAIFVAFVWFTSSEESRFRDFIRIISAIAVINTAGAILNHLFDRVGFNIYFFYANAIGSYQDNIISGILLTLVIMSTYHRLGKRAFLFGMTSQLATPLLFYYSIPSNSLNFLVSRIILVACLCWLMSGRKTVSTALMLYATYHIGSRFVWLFFNNLGSYFANVPFEEVIDSSQKIMTYFQSTFFEYLEYLYPDMVILVIVLSITLLFEKVILKVGREGTIETVQ